ncbi:MAG: glycosyltransferase family 2 protein [Pseudomonadota bacterium]
MDGSSTPGQTTFTQGAMPPEPQAVPAQDILVAIPVLNEVDHIEACLASLMEGNPRLKDIRFVVADGGSTDGTRALLDTLAGRFDNLEWIDNPGRLQSAGVNAVAASAQGETVLVRCDAHALYPPGYVARIADALRGHGVASIVVPMDAVGDTCFQRANAWVVDTPLGSGGSAHRGGTTSKFVDHGHHAGFDLGIFRSLGGYDERFSHNEDAEYDVRVSKAGGALFLDASLRLEYKPRPTARSLARQYFNYGKGRARTLLKHKIRPRPRQVFPVLNTAALIASLAAAPVFPLALVYPLAYALALAGASAWLTVKHRSACALLAGPAAGIMHIAWSAGFLKHLALGARR